MTTQQFFEVSPFFERYEFDSPDQVGSGNNMDVAFLLQLERARRIAGIAFVVNSGYRTPSHNKRVGGVADSAHTKGLAADIRVRDNYERAVINNALRGAGFTRLGIGSGFTHVDSDDTKPQPREWLYVVGPQSLSIKLSWFQRLWSRLKK